MKKISFLVAVILLIGAFNCVADKVLVVGDKARDFSLPDLSGKTVSLQSILKNGKPAAFVFWASWCPECRKQLPKINEAAKKYAAQMQFFSINTNDSKAGAIAYVKKEGIEFSALVDVAGTVADSYGIIGVPTMILIGKDGVVKSTDLDISEIDGFLKNSAPPSKPK